MVKIRKENVYGGLLFVFSVNTFVLYRPRFGNFLQPKVRLQKVAPWHAFALNWCRLHICIFHTIRQLLNFSHSSQLCQHHNQHLREKRPLHRLMDDSASPCKAPGFLGMFGRFAVIGDRLSPFVSGACMIMAFLGWRHRVEGWHAVGFVRSWRPILYKLWMFVIEF